MTVSTPESNKQNSMDFKKGPFVNRYKRNGGNKYNYELQHYPMPYGYYPPPSVYYPPITTRDDDLEIIMHDDNTSSADLSKRSDNKNKTINLKEQLEYYFSRQNLVNDTYLVSQMDADLYVPITIIANFKRVREWTTDINVIINTLRQSSTVTVNEIGTKVKPNISIERKTVILRDVPDCTEQEMLNLLKELNSPPVQSMKKDIGNMWYFTFESEQLALQLLFNVRGKSFKDQAIAARMKSEPLLRIPITNNNNNNNQQRNNQKMYQTNSRSSLSRVNTNKMRYINNKSIENRNDRFSSELSTTTNQLGKMTIRDGNKRRYNNNNNNHNNTNKLYPKNNYSRPLNKKSTKNDSIQESTIRRQEPNYNKTKTNNNNYHHHHNHNHNKKKRNKSTNITQTNKETELKPTSFPPLPTQTTTTTIKPLNNDSMSIKRSIADIVKSHSKKEVKKEEPKKEEIKTEEMKKEEDKKEEINKEEINKEETEAFPSLCAINERNKDNKFSYADMLKRKDQHK